MNQEHFSTRTKQVLIVAAAFFGASLAAITPAVAQQAAEVTVMRQEVGRTYSGIPIEVISLMRQVDYRDLDLATQSGVETLKGRIAETAKQACAQLDTLYPANGDPLDPPDQDCVKSAFDDGIAHARVAIAGGGKYSLR